MEKKFISEFGELDLSKVRFSTQEENAKVSDVLFTKFTFPFDIIADEDFIKKYGDYRSLETFGLRNKIPGEMIWENKVFEAFLYIQDIQGLKLTVQIDFGFEDVPNFEKKLSELPLENFQVPDIYSYAKTIAGKKYPETNFNFPRVFTTKYPATDQVWNAFDGYMNDLKKDGTEMRRNYIDGSGNIFNINIIHPMPHILYLLKTGFEDAGYQLRGDILTDQNLAQKWVYSGTEHFTRLTQNRLGLVKYAADYDQVVGWPSVIFYPKLQIEKKGKYKIVGYIRKSDKIKGSGFARILYNNTTIMSFEHHHFHEYHFHFNFEINAEDNSELTFILSDVKDLEYTNPVIKVDIINTELSNESQYTGTDLGVITNPNEVDLRRAVPEMTFGELVKIIKNWFNYDVDIQGKFVIMNLIANQTKNKVQDLRFLEIPEHLVKRTLLNKKSFLLKFPEMNDGFSKDSMYYDVEGPKINGKEKTDTNIIEINGYLMPLRLPKPQGYYTANVAKDSNSILALVEYQGLQNGQNNTTYSPGCDFPELFENNWLSFLRKRIQGQQFTWRKKVNKELASNISIKETSYCFNNNHTIKSINKDEVSENHYEIEIVTETEI